MDKNTKTKNRRQKRQQARAENFKKLQEEVAKSLDPQTQEGQILLPIDVIYPIETSFEIVEKVSVPEPFSFTRYFYSFLPSLPAFFQKNSTPSVPEIKEKQC